MPSGWFADKYRRDSMLRIGSLIGVVAGLALAAAVYTETTYLLIAAMGLVGIYKGINNVGIESIFADSVQTGKRCVRHLVGIHPCPAPCCLHCCFLVLLFAPATVHA